MISAIDTNVLLDVLIPGATHAETSEAALLRAAGDGALIISEPVYAELAAHFGDRSTVARFLEDTSVALASSSADALSLAGSAWSQHQKRRPRRLACAECGAAQDLRCQRCGASIHPRQHVVADFLIGGHALILADQLLTRNRGFYAGYFPELALAEPV
jgi:predicted nucleic acid-binding protein